MALDTKTKRASVPGVGRPWYRTKQPAANSVAWRWASGNTYAVNAATVVTVVTGCTVARDIYQGGSVAGETYQGGMQRAEVYQGGTIAIQAGCD